MKKTVKRKNIILSTHSDIENWILMFISVQRVPWSTKMLNIYPVLSIFQGYPRPHYFCILFQRLIGSLRRNQVGYSYILVMIVRLWDLVRLYLPPHRCYIFKAHQHQKIISENLYSQASLRNQIKICYSTNFKDLTMQEVSKALLIKLLKMSVYHGQLDGLVKRRTKY